MFFYRLAAFVAHLYFAATRTDFDRADIKDEYVHVATVVNGKVIRHAAIS